MIKRLTVAQEARGAPAARRERTEADDVPSVSERAC